MDEPTFINAVVAEADCYLHLDVNNIYVNSQNFGFDPHAFLQKLSLERVCYIHVAGHFTEDNGLLIDTHGADVIDPVWSLLEATYLRTGLVPTCLERDNNIPPLHELLLEIEHIRQLQNAAIIAQQVAA
jgi:uncharacterized protein (UPF0276 family)